MKKLLSILLSISMLIIASSCAYQPKKPGPSLSADVVNIDLYAVNDMHGNVVDGDGKYNGLGISKTSSYLKKMKSYNQNSIFLSSGDMWQGSSESNNTHGKIVTEWMNLLDFSSMTVGNHEFDWGIERISENKEIARFPFLGINVYDKETNERSEVFDSSVMVEKDGVSIGIIGAIGDCYSSISSSKVTDLYFKTGDELTELVKEESKKLKDEGADVVVYSLHDGYSGGNYKTTSEEAPTLDSGKIKSFYDVSLSDGYVDVVFEGHTHQKYVYKDAYGVYHVQASANNRAIAHVDVDVNKKTGDVKVNTVRTADTSAIMEGKDAQTEALFDKYADDIGKVYEVIGQNYKKRYSDEIEDLCADLYLKAGLQEWGEEYEIFLGGGYLKTRSPYNLEAGNVCYKDLQSLMPFDNEIVLCSVSGADLSNKFVNTSNRDYHCSYSEFGEKNKSDIDFSKTYYIVVDSYTSDYAFNRLTVIKRYSKLNFYARDLLAEYIKNGGLS